ncbi:lipopolysaccharide biosynthesis protein [Mucilaginibacter ginkgonis]|uniref:Lipopolysaccharide biosynthesis protein n=1 Tax=Mucilaginibacter ginkgonis TaxID=2682091 RepID=A0A6I4IMT7_9SPHI|nr:lipopolysaccharide biosynthesis protein [Mucilaginibacter ginkgonis]QQL51016.1 lipopolysaccharide biosynthesis protein [Mucilaginibacter ginkgonis]
MFKAVLQKLRNPHFINLVGNAIMSLLNMIQVAILFNYLSMPDMGIWFFFQGTISLVDTSRAGFLSTAFITSYAGTTKERAADVAGSAWYLSLIITAIIVMVNIGYIFSPWHVKDAGTDLILKWIGVVFIITLPSFIASCVLQAEQRFDRLLIIRSVSTSISIILIIVFIALKKVTLMNVIYIGFVAGGVTGLMTVVTGWSRINTLINKTGTTVRALFNYGKYSIGTALGTNLFSTTDTYIINFTLGPSALAIYNLGLRLMELVEIPLRSFAATIIAPLAAAYNRGEKSYCIYLLKKYAGMTTILLLPIVAGSLAFAEVGVWIVDKHYLSTPAANVLRIFMSFALLYPIERYMALTLDAINQPRVNMIKLFFMVIGNLVGDFLGVYIFKSVYGIAFGTIIPVLIGYGIAYVYLQKYTQFTLKDTYKIGWDETLKLLRGAKNMLRKKQTV